MLRPILRLKAFVPFQELSERCAAMAIFCFLLRAQLGERAALPSRSEPAGRSAVDAVDQAWGEIEVAQNDVVADR